MTRMLPRVLSGELRMSDGPCSLFGRTILSGGRYTLMGDLSEDTQSKRVFGLPNFETG